MYGLLLLISLSGLISIFIGVNTNILIGYLAYSGLIAAFTLIFIGASLLINYVNKPQEKIITYKVLHFDENDDNIVVEGGYVLPKSRIDTIVFTDETVPKLEITMFHISDVLSRWVIPICIQPDVWTLYR